MRTRDLLIILFAFYLTLTINLAANFHFNRTIEQFFLIESKRDALKKKKDKKKAIENEVFQEMRKTLADLWINFLIYF